MSHAYYVDGILYTADLESLWTGVFADPTRDVACLDLPNDLPVFSVDPLPYKLGRDVVPLNDEMREAMTRRFDVFGDFVIQKQDQKRADPLLAKRFMIQLKYPIIFNHFVIRQSILATVRGGERQMTHLDMSGLLAELRDVWVYIQNLGSKPFIIYVRVHGVDTRVQVPVGMYITFPATTPHAGSGEVHHHRLYVLYSRHALTPEQTQEIIADSMSLVAVP